MLHWLRMQSHSYNGELMRLVQWLDYAWMTWDAQVRLHEEAAVAGLVVQVRVEHPPMEGNADSPMWDVG